MSGMYTGNMDHLIRSELWSTQLKEILEDEMQAQKYVSMLQGFPDGDTFTIPSIAEGVGISRAAAAEEMPVAISFTVETDGQLPSRETLQDAIEQVDRASDRPPAYYMINCAHPSHFADVLNGAPWTERIRAVRANASTKSHAELDAATKLDEGDPEELGAGYRDLAMSLENLAILGGCCGTDHRHVAHIGRTFADRR